MRGPSRPERPRKAIKFAIKRMSAVRLRMADSPMTEQEWKEFNDLYKIMGDIRSAQVDFGRFER